MQMTDSRDYAKGTGMSLLDLEQRLADIENEPNWRPSADKCADYYDHKQSSAERLSRHADTGEPMVTINLIQRTINGALGQEAKTRLNWKAQADTQVFNDVAAVMNERLHEFQREAKTDMAISEAYSSMLRTGIGWVEVSRNPDPLGYYGRAVAVHRNEVWWDWRARLPDKSDAQWIVRQRWADVDEAAAIFPQHAEMLHIGCHSGPITDAMARTILTTRDQFENIYSTRRSFSRAEEEWLDNSLRKRVRLYSVYYKKHVQALALVSGTKRVRFNPRNPIHQMLAQGGGAKLVKGPSFEIRHAMFAGPYRMFDVPFPGRRFPLVPFVCYSCDDDRSPYGLVHGMIEPQDEFNKRRSRLMWLLEAKQVFVDDDALDQKFNTFQDVAKEVMRPDAMFVLNSQRRYQDGMRVNTNMGLAKEQAEVMNSAQVLIQDQPGLFSPQFGSNAVGANSGVALNNLLEQSVASLGETSDNYRNGRQACGDLAMQLIAEDLDQPNMQLEIGTGKRRRVVVLNAFDERGLPVNHVEDSEVRVALGDVPTTPAYRAQQQVFLSQAIQSVGNDPIARAVLIPALLESSDLEHRDVYAKWMRKQAGVPEPEEMVDGPQAEQQEMAEQQAAQQQSQEQGQLQMRAALADVAKKEGDAMLAQAKAAQAGASAQDQMLTNAAAMQPQPMNPAANEDLLIQEALAEAG